MLAAVESCPVTRLDAKDSYEKCKSVKTSGGNCSNCKSSKVDAISSREECKPVLLCTLKRNKRVNALAVCGYHERKA